MTQTQQTNIDQYRVMNRYDERNQPWPSTTVYESPRRTTRNGWAKFHADRECGRKNVVYVEARSRGITTDKREYRLRCTSCGHFIDEDEVLFIGGKWYNTVGIRHYTRPVDQLMIPPERVLELGPNPDQEELINALEVSWAESQMSTHGLAFGCESYSECEDCGEETFVLFGDQCRMCYGGEITEQMWDVLGSLERSIRERNGSFVHRLPEKVDPLASLDQIPRHRVLWRRCSNPETETYPRVIVIKDLLESQVTGERTYVATDPRDGSTYRISEDEIGELFYDTGASDSQRSQPPSLDHVLDALDTLGSEEDPTEHVEECDGGRE